MIRTNMDEDIFELHITIRDRCCMTMYDVLSHTELRKDCIASEHALKITITTQFSSQSFYAVALPVSKYLNELSNFSIERFGVAPLNNNLNAGLVAEIAPDCSLLLRRFGFHIDSGYSRSNAIWVIRDSTYNRDIFLQDYAIVRAARASQSNNNSAEVQPNLKNKYSADDLETLFKEWDKLIKQD